MDVNSVQLRGDTIYSFGRALPDGEGHPDSRGYVRRVVVNSDHYPSRGFANTGWDQSNVKRAVEDRVGARGGRSSSTPAAQRVRWPKLRLRPELNDSSRSLIRERRSPRTSTRGILDPSRWTMASAASRARASADLGRRSFILTRGEERPDDEYVRDGSSEHLRVKRTTEGFIDYTREAPNYWDRQRAEEATSPHRTEAVPALRGVRAASSAWSIQMHGGWARERTFRLRASPRADGEVRWRTGLARTRVERTTGACDG
jgi:hypothetical protein